MAKRRAGYSPPALSVFTITGIGCRGLHQDTSTKVHVNPPPLMPSWLFFVCPGDPATPGFSAVSFEVDLYWSTKDGWGASVFMALPSCIAQGIPINKWQRFSSSAAKICRKNLYPHEPHVLPITPNSVKGDLFPLTRIPVSKLPAGA